MLTDFKWSSFLCIVNIQEIKTEVNKIATASDEIPFVFHAPLTNPWFSGRVSELEDLTNLLRLDDSSQSKVNIAAVCGLGGVGKTSLATEYAQQSKDYYTGGVYWFSGENDTTFENSVYDVSTRFGTQNDSFARTFSATLAIISRNKKPWLIVLDNMDQLSLSASFVKLVSGTWQHDASGHLLITTRRKPTAIANDIRDFDERCCLSLKCFEIQEGKKFLFRRIGMVQHEEADTPAEKLVERLGGLPLALEQAGAYIKSLPCKLSQYLELYDKQRLRLLDRQIATPVSEYDSPERLAVRTTWHLNFEHIKQAVDDGKAASRFLYASAFLNPNEIQKNLINVGEPPVEDEEYCECVETSLGRQHVLKLLTDFSLFKETPSSNLSVHHLVQEVVQDNLDDNPEEKIQSVINAIRMLHHAFQKSPSPDELLSSVKNQRQRPSIFPSTNLSRFYQWNKLCLHSYELVKHLKTILKQSNGDSTNILKPETARVVYECAIHLSANLKHDEAKEVANFANDILNFRKQNVSASSVFPHIIPLPESVRRHIQYSCNTPGISEQEGSRDGAGMLNHSVTSEQLGEMRMKGNELFKRGCYNDALKMYSDAVDISKNTAFFDVRLLSNRASVYLKLEQYEAALQDASEYILQRPKCWRGYARKALALFELSDIQGAYVAASLAYYYDRNVFRDFEPFGKKFDSSLEMRLFVCRNSSDLSAALCKVTASHSSSKSDDFPIIILQPGDYPVSLHTFDSGHFLGLEDNVYVLYVGSCFLIGCESGCSISFDDNLGVFFSKVLVAYNIAFRCRLTGFHVQPGSEVKLSHCSFSSSNPTYTSFTCKGRLKVDFCKFHNCTRGGMLVLGHAEIENSEFYGNAYIGLDVREGGRLLVRKTKLYANLTGLHIGPEAKECVVEDCELYDNKRGGILVSKCVSSITIRRSRIYHNGEPGITVMKNSNVFILENEILGNSHWGVYINMFSHAVVKKNKIQDNQCGGIYIDTHSFVKRSVIEYNHISFNFGPGIYDVGIQTSKRKENTLHDNKEERSQSTAQSEAKLCYYCKKPENNLRKCTNCFKAQYCGRHCQKSDWKNHKEVCNRLLSDVSIVVNYVRYPIMTAHLSPNVRTSKTLYLSKLDPGLGPGLGISHRAPGLLPVGPRYCPPPNTTTRFVVKVSAGVQEGKDTETDYEPVVRLYDRSLTIDGILTDADQIHNIVRQHGTIGQARNDWKKLFMWVKGPENGKLRVFTNEFPPYQNW